MDLLRLDLPQLIEQGRKALQEESYGQAVLFFREAISRAPFRQDLKDWMAMALEGTFITTDDEPAAPQSTLSAMQGKAGRTASEATPEASIEAQPQVTASSRPPVTGPPAAERSSELASPVFRPHPVGTGATAQTFSSHSHSRKPSQFAKRHRRGPLSALLLGAVFGLVLIGSVMGGVYFYLGSQISVEDQGQAPTISRAQVDSIVEQAYNYRQRGEYALAIEQLKGLPSGGERDHLLAETCMEQGNLNFHQTPPQLESAIEAYKNAVRFAPGEPEYGYSLGMAYLDLSREKESDTEVASQYLDLSRRTFQAVLDRHPDHISSLDGLSRVAVRQRDDVTAADTWRRIIEVEPDSYEAERARNNLKSLNYKF